MDLPQFIYSTAASLEKRNLIILSKYVIEKYPNIWEFGRFEVGRIIRSWKQKWHQPEEEVDMVFILQWAHKVRCWRMRFRSERYRERNNVWDNFYFHSWYNQHIVLSKKYLFNEVLRIRAFLQCWGFLLSTKCCVTGAFPTWTSLCARIISLHVHQKMMIFKSVSGLLRKFWLS